MRPFLRSRCPGARCHIGPKTEIARAKVMQRRAAALRSEFGRAGYPEACNLARVRTVP